MASAGPSDARTQPAWRGIATRAGEDAAARSVPAAASGVPGRVEGTQKKVTCKVKGSKKVTCTVKPSQSSKRKNLSWSLHRAGHTLSHGTTSAARLQAVLNDLRPGTYALHLHGQKGSTSITVG